MKKASSGFCLMSCVRDQCSEKSAATSLPVQILLDVACSFPSYIVSCYNSTLLGLLFLIVASRFKQASS